MLVRLHLSLGHEPEDQIRSFGVKQGEIWVRWNKVIFYILYPSVLILEQVL